MKKILLMLSLFCTLCITVNAQTNTWIGAGANDNWNTVANWSLNAVPTAINDVVIPTGSTAVLNVTGTTKSISVQGNALFTINSTLNFTDASSFGANTTIIFSDGSINGGSTLTNNGIINITTTGSKYIDNNTVLNNLGTINFTGTGTLFINNGTLNNRTSGIIDLQTAGNLISYNGGSNHIFNNYGLLKRTSATGIATIQSELHNDGGTINVQAGELTLNFALIKLTGGIYNVSANSSLNWANTVTCEGVLTGSLNGPINWVGNVSIPVAATFNFTGNTGVHWNNGTLQGGGILTNMNKITMLETNSRYINGNTVLTNEGVINFENTGVLFVNEGTINNEISGLLNLKSDGNDISYNGGSTHILNNYGLIKRSVTSGTSSINIVLNNNSGTITVESGILNFRGLAKNLTGGTYNVANNSSLLWNTQIICSETLDGVLDGEILWNNEINVPDNTTSTFNFTGTTGVNWSNGNLNGGGTLINQSEITLLTTNSKYINTNSVLTNNGDINFESSGVLFVNNGAINNEATGIINLKADGNNISYNGGSVHDLNNSGLIKSNVPTGTSTISIYLHNNDGTILVESGNLNFINLTKYLNNGIYNVNAGSSLNWNSQIILTGNLTGNLDGQLIWNAEVNVPSEITANFDFTGTTGVHWVNGSLDGAGILVNKSEITLLSTSSKYINSNTILNNEGLINYESSGVMFINNGTVNNQPTGIMDLKADGTSMAYNGGSTHILNNFGLLKRTTTTGASSVDILVNNNNGTISVESGILNFSGLTKNLSNGTYNVLSGSVLQWNAQIVCNGTLEGNLNGELIWNNEVQVPVNTNAIFNFIGPTGVHWKNGNLKGGGTLTNEGKITLLTTASKYIQDNSVLNNNGQINYESTGVLFVNDGIVNNQALGVIDLKSDGNFLSYNGGSSHVFNNIGLLTKSEGTATTSITAVSTNSGIIDILSGELEFSDNFNFTNSIDGVVKGIGTIDLPTATNFTNNGTFAPGGSPGVLNVLGTYKSSSTSVLDVELNGLVQGQEYDFMNVTGTNAVFEGQVNIALGFDANVGDSFTIATVSGIIATKNLTSPVYGDYGCKHYTFNVTYPNDKNVMLTISGKADIIAPDVITQNVTVQLNASGNASITASQINNGSTDNCTLPANLTLALNVTNFTCANLGDNTVTLTVTDEAGNSASANATITVEDLIDPVISTCPGNITVVGDSETGYTIPDYFGSGEVTASDNCSVSTVVQVPAPGAVVVTGTTSVMVTVSDSSGNSAVCSFDVEVTLSIDSYELTDASILMYPNPANQNVTLKNNGNQQLKSAIIIDVKGSVIQEINLEDMGISKTISIQDYASGVYFVKIYSEFSNLVKRLIKQ